MIVGQEEELRTEAASCLQDLTKKSRLFNVNTEISTPRFDPDGKKS